MGRGKALAAAFGVDESGLVAVPAKRSGASLARVELGNAMGCSWCFPHGEETVNATWRKRQRSWKRYRATRYRVVRPG